MQLEGIIGRAMEKDREKRYHSASDIKADLQRLKKESESAMLRSAARQLPLRMVTKTFATSSATQRYLIIGLAAILAMLLVTFGVWYFKHRALLAGPATRMPWRCCRYRT